MRWMQHLLLPLQSPVVWPSQTLPLRLRKQLKSILHFPPSDGYGEPALDAVALIAIQIRVQLIALCATIEDALVSLSMPLGM